METTRDEDSAATWPRYQSHKQVLAVKIGAIMTGRAEDGSATIVPADKRIGMFAVPADYLDKHDPQIGGYFVQYDDGYMSWSPAEAFEKGYTEIAGAVTGEQIPQQDVMREKTRTLEPQEVDQMNTVKRLGNQFVGYLDTLERADNRRCALAVTNAEQAVMWAVKSITG